MVGTNSAEGEKETFDLRRFWPVMSGQCLLFKQGFDTNCLALRSARILLIVRADRPEPLSAWLVDDAANPATGPPLKRDEAQGGRARQK